jgi:hypothetical protein
MIALRSFISDQMHDTGLYDCLREHGRDRFRKAFRSVNDRDQNIVDTSGFEFVDDFLPEFGAFRLLDPEAQDFFLARDR